MRPARPRAVLRLKRGHDRAKSHPWIFKGDVADVSDVEPGAAVTVLGISVLSASVPLVGATVHATALEAG